MGEVDNKNGKKKMGQQQARVKNNNRKQIKVLRKGRTLFSVPHRASAVTMSCLLLLSSMFGFSNPSTMHCMYTVF